MRQRSRELNLIVPLMYDLNGYLSRGYPKEDRNNAETANNIGFPVFQISVVIMQQIVPPVATCRWIYQQRLDTYTFLLKELN